jgi:Ca-activated chloride channel family protein
VKQTPSSCATRWLDARDRVSIVVYAGASGLVLPPTSGSERQDILDSLDRLQAGGSTNGGQGIELAYATAARHFVEGGVNRVILATRRRLQRRHHQPE